MKKGSIFRGSLLLNAILIILVMSLTVAFVKRETREEATSPDTKGSTSLPTTTEVPTQLTTPTQSEDISTWPSYLNKTYSYQISYPPNWVMDDNEWMSEKKSVDELLRFWSKYDYTQGLNQPKLRADIAVFVIEVVKITGDETVESFAVKQNMPPEQKTTKLVETTEITIDGLPAKKYLFRNDYAQWNPIYLKKDDLMFHIQADRGEMISEQQFNALAEKIIASIKFL